MALMPPPDHGANRRNLARLCLLRGVLVVALLLAALLASLLQGLPLHRDGGLVLAVLGLTAFNFWTLWRLRRGVPVGEAGLFLQLVADVLLMSLVFYRTGGATNPFVSWYLVPLTIAAATLRLRFTVGVAVLALSAYTVLLSHYVPFSLFGAEPGLVLEKVTPPAIVATPDPHAGHDMAGQTGVHEGFNVHIVGMWLNFLLSAGLITFFVSRMSHALREQDRRLAEQREHLLQREQVVALGALAAGAAHELGTPLATMSVIARDIEAELPADSPLREDAVLLRSQLAQCREILHGLRAQAAGERIRQPLSRLLGDAVERMQLMHPARAFALSLDLADRTVQAPATLPQVLVNLVDNAAQAARGEVALRAAEAGGEFLLEIRDDGPGIAPEVAGRLGEPFVSGRADGLGIGYFLSHASVNQWGGSIHLQARPEGGTLTTLRLPWPVLRPEPAAGGT
jgi:two-component system sensor histidine kinase RegB